MVGGIYSYLDCDVSRSCSCLVLYDSGMPFTEKVSFSIVTVGKVFRRSIRCS